MTTTIYHNPRCSNSRGTLELIRSVGIEPQVVDYLEHPPTVDQLRSLIERAGLTVREAVRTKEPVYAELALDTATDEQLLAAMVAHPILINRPFVATEKGVRLCRPPGLVREILP
ncbi:MAG: arsenate reductase (glutaredoxin) [Telluria sp.]